MEYLSEINDSLLQLRETNKSLKRRLNESEDELERLRRINSEQEKRLNELESHISKSSDNLTNFIDVMICLKNIKKVEVIDKCDYCDKKFEKIVTDLSLQSVKLGFSGYTEIAEYLKQEIRVKTGVECFVSVGLYESYSFQTWTYKNRKFIALKIGKVFITVNQIHTKFSDIVKCAKNTTYTEIIEKSEQIDAHFENVILELAHDIVNTSSFTTSCEISNFMKTEINQKYGKIYGTNWLVTVGFGPYYDMSYSVRISKRKFLDFSINDLRFTVFQTL